MHTLLLTKILIGKFLIGKFLRTKPRPLIVELVDEEEVLHWTNEGKGYQTLSGYWI